MARVHEAFARTPRYPTLTMAPPHTDHDTDVSASSRVDFDLDARLRAHAQPAVMPGRGFGRDGQVGAWLELGPDCGMTGALTRAWRGPG